MQIGDKVVCISGSEFLTKGKIYTIELISKGYIQIYGQAKFFNYKENFKTLSEIREEKIEYFLNEINEN